MLSCVINMVRGQPSISRVIDYIPRTKVYSSPRASARECTNVIIIRNFTF